jgi:RNA polymerase sigma-70 factor, ECF subfamily
VVIVPSHILLGNKCRTALKCISDFSGKTENSCLLSSVEVSIEFILGVESSPHMEESALDLHDAGLVERISHGETAAEARLYEKYSARVYYIARGELRSPQDAEDVRAETFLRVLQAIRGNRLRSPEALSSFVLSTARNVIREQLRQKRKTESLDDQPSADESSYEQHHAFLDADVKKAIEKVVRRLKTREQAFLRMYYYDELPKGEIARRLGIKEERLRLIKSRALKSFREYYERLRQKE